MFKNSKVVLLPTNQKATSAIMLGVMPNEEWGELKRTRYVKSNNITPVKKVGRIVFD